MDDRKVPLYIYEGTTARFERSIKRLIIVIIIAIALLFLSNLAWLYCWMQYDYVYEEYSYSQDGEGLNNFNMGNQGGITYEPKSSGETSN